MNKQEFLARLRGGLAGLPQSDIDERLTFYSEMIDDRMEDGIPEETAVREIGTVDELVSQIVADIPLTKLVKERVTPKKKLNGWEIVLLTLGSPIWLSLLLAVAAVILSLYAALWSVILALWTVFVSFAVCGLTGAAMGIVYAVKGDTLSGFALIGAGILCVGLSVFLFYGCKAASRSILYLTKKSVMWIKNGLIKKEKTT